MAGRYVIAEGDRVDTPVQKAAFSLATWREYIGVPDSEAFPHRELPDGLAFEAYPVPRYRGYGTHAWRWGKRPGYTCAAGRIVYQAVGGPHPGDEVYVVEGESDTEILHSLGYPVVGLPGAGMIGDGTALFDAVPPSSTLLFVREPDDGGTQFTRAGLKAACGRGMRDQVRFVSLAGGYKDIRALWFASDCSPSEFRRRLAEAKRIVPVTKRERSYKDLPLGYYRTDAARETLYVRHGNRWADTPGLVNRQLARDGGNPENEGRGLRWRVMSEAAEVAQPRGRAVYAANGIVSLDGCDFAAYGQDNESFIALDTPYEFDAEAPRLTAWLERTLPDPEWRRLWLETVGYAASSTALLKHIIVFWGPKDTGKSLAVEIIGRLLGPSQVWTTSVEDVFRSRFGLAALHHRLALLGPEMRLGGAIRATTLKSLAGGVDQMIADRKYRNPIQLDKRAAVILASNTLPGAERDSDEAYLARLVVIPFVNPVPVGEQDPELLAELTTPEELAGLLRMAVAAFRAAGCRLRPPTAHEDIKRLVAAYAGADFSVIDEILQRRPEWSGEYMEHLRERSQYGVATSPEGLLEWILHNKPLADVLGWIGGGSDGGGEEKQTGDGGASVEGGDGVQRRDAPSVGGDRPESAYGGHNGDISGSYPNGAETGGPPGGGPGSGSGRGLLGYPFSGRGGTGGVADGGAGLHNGGGPSAYPHRPASRRVSSRRWGAGSDEGPAGGGDGTGQGGTTTVSSESEPTGGPG